MATADQILGLVKSHAEGDDERLYAIALQIAAAEAKRGRESKAQQLRSAVDAARTSRPRLRSARPGSAAPAASMGLQAGTRLASLAIVSEPRTRLQDLVLAESLVDSLGELLRQQRQRGRLRDHGLWPDSRLLLVGPPGCGKTMSASALAGELHLPLITVRLDALITRYLGETAAHLRQIFDEIHDRRAVYLFDEFDALGASRTEAHDVGEIRRVLNSFLQFVEEPNTTDSLIVATTNRPASLDLALARRFDRVLRYEPPSEEEAREVLERHLGRFLPRSGVTKRAIELTSGLSQAEIAQAAREAVKNAVLDENKLVEARQVEGALARRRVMCLEMERKSDPEPDR